MIVGDILGVGYVCILAHRGLAVLVSEYLLSKLIYVHISVSESPSRNYSDRAIANDGGSW